MIFVIKYKNLLHHTFNAPTYYIPQFFLSVCVCVCVRAWARGRVGAWARARVGVCARGRARVWACARVCERVCVCVCVCVCSLTQVVFTSVHFLLHFLASLSSNRYRNLQSVFGKYSEPPY
jgi:hypothetical protein